MSEDRYRRPGRALPAGFLVIAALAALLLVPQLRGIAWVLAVAIVLVGIAMVVPWSRRR